MHVNGYPAFRSRLRRTHAIICSGLDGDVGTVQIVVIPVFGGDGVQSRLVHELHKQFELLSRTVTLPVANAHEQRRPAKTRKGERRWLRNPINIEAAKAEQFGG